MLGLEAVSETPVSATPVSGSAGTANGQATVNGVTIVAVVAAGAADGFASVAGFGVAASVTAGEADGYAIVIGAGRAILTPNVLPSFPALGWPVHRRPTYETVIAPHPSGGEVRRAMWPAGLWEFELTLDAMSGDAVNYPGAGANSLQTMMGFYLAQGGQQGTFLYIDPDFSSCTAQGVGVGDGALTSFPLMRSVGAAIEPVSWALAVSAVTVAGLPASGWSLLQPATIVLAAAPTTGAVVAASFTYAFACRFLEDSIDFEESMYNLWQLKSLKFRQVRL